MKRSVLLAVLLLPAAAFAQPPKDIVGSDTIEFQVGQTRTLEFDQPLERLVLSDDSIAKVSPQTDRTFAIKALQPGDVLMTAVAPDGSVIHRSNINVAGSLVKVYGQKKQGQSDAVAGGVVVRADRNNPDYVAYICTSTGCGRADTDIKTGPSAVIITDTQGKGDGSSSVTREYR